jgi:hypothetical protein
LVYSPVAFGRRKQRGEGFEYLIVDGRVSDEPSRWLYSADVPSDDVGQARSGAAEQISRTISEEGLVDGWPIS